LYTIPNLIVPRGQLPPISDEICRKFDIPLDMICWLYIYFTNKTLPISDNDDCDDILDGPHFTKQQLDDELDEYIDRRS